MTRTKKHLTTNSVKSIFSAAALVAALSLAAHATVRMNVTVVDASNGNAPLANVPVIAQTHDPNTHEPDFANTFIGTTAADGTVSFDLAADRFYNIVADKNGHTPLNQQMFNPSNGIFTNPDGQTVARTISLTALTGEAAKVGTVTMHLSNIPFAPAIIFGGVNREGSYEPAGMAILKHNSGTSADITVNNVPYADRGTYFVNAYMPTDGTNESKGTGKKLDGVDINLNTPNVETNLDFANGTRPRQVAESEVVEGDLGVEGVVTRFDNNAALEGARLFLFCQDPCPQQGPCNPDPSAFTNLQAYTDSGGYYSFRNLPAGKQCHMNVQTNGFVTHDVNDELHINNYVAGTKYVKDIKMDAVSANKKLVGKVVIDPGTPNDTSDDVPMPNAHVNVWGDWDAWDTDGNPGTDSVQNQGRGNGEANTDKNGSFTIAGIPEGNYSLQAWTPFVNQGTEFNNGADGQRNYASGNTRGGDDRRVSILGENNSRFYNASGTELGTANDTATSTLIIRVSANNNGTGHIRGTVSFDAATDLSETPIILTANEDCQSATDGCQNRPPKGGFAIINGSGQSSYTYDMVVPTGEGAKYWVNLESENFAEIKEGDFRGQVDLSERTTVDNLDYHMAPAGKIKVTVITPDGNAFQPRWGDQNTSRSANINAGCEEGGARTWDWGQVGDDGTGTVAILPCNDARVEIRGWGGGYTYANVELNKVVVKAPVNNEVQTTEITVQLEPGVLITPQITGTLPDITTGVHEGQRLQIIGVEAGTKIDVTNYQKVLGLFENSPTSIQYWEEPETRWEDNKRIKAGRYDFYMVLESNYGDDHDIQPGSQPETHFFLRILTVAKGVEVIDTNATVNTINGLAVPIALTMPTLGDRSIGGAVTALNFITEDQYNALNDIDALIGYIPAVAVYDQNGTLMGITMNAPLPKPGQTTEQFSGFLDQIEDAIANKTGFAAFGDLLAEVGFGFQLRFLPDAEYNIVAFSPNYPPYFTKVRSGTTDLTINLDSVVGAGGTIRGTVTNSGGNPIEGAAITIEGKLAKKSLVTGANGTYSQTGLASGRYKVKVTASGKAPDQEGVTVSGTDTTTVNFQLADGPGSITGKVILQGLFPVAVPEATIVAFNETKAGTQTKRPYLYVTATDKNGSYTLEGLITGDVYRITASHPGKFPASIQVTATAGALTGKDVVLQPKPPVPQVQAKKVPGTTATYKIFIKADKEVDKATVNYVAGTTYTDTGATNISEQFTPGSDNTYTAQIALPSATDHVLRVAFTANGREGNVDVILGTQEHANIPLNQTSDEAEAAFDQDGDDPTKCTVPAASVVSDSNAQIPEIEIIKQDADSSPIADDPADGGEILGEIYEMTLDGGSFVDDRGVDISIGLSDEAKEQILTDPDSVTVRHYNTVTGEWEEIEELTFDPMGNTLTFSAESFGAPNGTETQAQAQAMGLATFDGKKYVTNRFSRNALLPQAADSGSFALFSSVAGTNYGGTVVKAFNFPNPFVIGSKSPTLVHGGGSSITTEGTIMKLELPAGKGGNVDIRIYNIAGELVREYHMGTLAASTHHYQDWDGRNKDGDRVASGVYFAVIDIPGDDDPVIKMALVK